MRELGPFSGLYEYRKRGGGYSGGTVIVSSGKDAAVLEALKACGVMSAYQLKLYLGVRELNSMAGLARRGLVDVYESGKTPPLYALGPAGADLLGVPYRVYRGLEVCRLAAANQLWVWLRKVWPDAEWDVCGGYPLLVRRGIVYVVAAPRYRVGEGVYLAGAYAAGERVLVIMAHGDQYRELPLPSDPGRVRYTWDNLLKEGVRFYKLEGSRLVEDAVFSAILGGTKNLSVGY